MNPASLPAPARMTWEALAGQEDVTEDQIRRVVEQACEAERLRWQAGESATWRELWYDVRGRWQEVVLARLLEQDAGRDLRTMLGQEMQKKVRARYVFRSVGEGATEFDERCQRVFDRTFLERAKRQYAAAMRPQRGAWARDYLPL